MLKIAVPTNRPQAPANYLYALSQLGAQGETGTSFSPDEYDGLLLPGGWDVNPSRYGKTPIPQETIDDGLDEIQFAVLENFLEAGKPVLGICRGHQLLNVALGGTLVQDLPSAERHRSLPSGDDHIHPVRVEESSFLYRIYGPACTVNSSHHQGIERLGKGLRAAAFSEDGVIEAIGHESLPLWGVQWHPERMCFLHKRGDTVDGSEIFRFFLDRCRIAK